MPKKTTDPATRFWRLVDKSGDCWVWTGSLNNKGYGKFSLRSGSWVLAHRWAFESVGGPLASGLCVLHRCDNPKCVRPDHLFAGTVADNNADMDAKGRRVANFGEASGVAKLTAPAVLEIRSLYMRGVSRRTLSQRFLVGYSTISEVVRGRSWKHLLENTHAAD
ncbi:MAG: HNH endonuclease [Planctomycetia bacterium]|nr:HNH endonuclease [Planctomycetia bacterium]